MHVAVNPSFQKKKPVSTTSLPWNFAEWFVISQTFFPALLYFPGTQHFRILIRLAAYGTAIVVLLYVHYVMNPKRRIAPHPSSLWLFGVLGWVSLMILHPYTNSFLTGFATVGMYFAIMAPVFWVWAFVQTPGRLYRLLWLFLICNGINCAVGVRQVKDPWLLPPEFTSVLADEGQIQALIYEGAGGRIIVRPPGLGDTPGAVSGPGFFALYLGLVLAIELYTWRRRITAFHLSMVGAAAIFASLVRSALLIGVGMLIIYFLLMLIRGKIGRASSILAISVIAVLGAYIYSANFGGTSLTDRFSTLFEEDPSTLYYDSRGIMIEDSFTTGSVSKYIVGQGLGRYGMINNYFGNQTKLDSRPIWVEIQWPGWLVDGGILLVFLYAMAIVIAFYQQLVLQFTHPDPQVRDLASIIFALNSGLFALTFSYGVFLSPLGVEFWFLSGALHAVAYNTNPHPKHSRLKFNSVVTQPPDVEMPAYEPKMVSRAQPGRKPPA